VSQYLQEKLEPGGNFQAQKLMMISFLLLVELTVTTMTAKQFIGRLLKRAKPLVLLLLLFH
jgi:hypothetical protein